MPTKETIMPDRLPTVTREELRRRRTGANGNSPLDAPFAKNALVESVSRNILTSPIRGVDPAFAAEAAINSFERGGTPEIMQYLEARAAPTVANTQELPLAINSMAQDVYEATEARRNEIDFSDQVSAAWDLFSGTSALKDLIVEERFEHDPGFDYMSVREELEAGLGYDSVVHLRENAR